MKAVAANHSSVALGPHATTNHCSLHRWRYPQFADDRSLPASASRARVTSSKPRGDPQTSKGEREAPMLHRVSFGEPMWDDFAASELLPSTPFCRPQNVVRAHRNRRSVPSDAEGRSGYGACLSHGQVNNSWTNKKQDMRPTLSSTFEPLFRVRGCLLQAS